MSNHINTRGVSVVVVGSFNPAIITPFWLSKKELIREEEATNAHVKFINNDYASYDLSWLKVEVLLDKITLICDEEAYFEIVKDLVIGIFSYLKETPIKAFGINYIYHLNPTTEEKHYEIGNFLAPLENWNFLNEPKILSLEILDKGFTKDGYRRINIQPSDKVGKFGISININNHCNCSIDNFNAMFADSWEKCYKGTEQIVQSFCEKIF